MSAEPIGHVAMLQARREAAVERLSPAAKHRAFPGIYATPVPYESTEGKTRQKIRALEADKAKLARENADLRQTIADLQARLVTASHAARITQRRQNARDVMMAFLDAFNAGRPGSKQWTLEHLTSSYRSHNYAAPRHVCIWLVCELCTHLSLQQIARHFGGRHHTTVLHAEMRGPQWMASDPDLRSAADAVLQRFGATK